MKVNLLHAHGSPTRYRSVYGSCRCGSCRSAELEYYQKFRAQHPGYMTKYRDRWKKRYPEKRRAQKAVANAIRGGHLKRQPCEVCGAHAEGHHGDYDKPLEVRWLCMSHHRKLHAGMR